MAITKKLAHKRVRSGKHEGRQFHTVFKVDPKCGNHMGRLFSRDSKQRTSKS